MTETIEPWHGYATCPVCGSTDISEDTGEDPLILVVFCNGCGQTLTDTFIGEDGQVQSARAVLWRAP
jgi:hypothetical protein